MKRTLLYVFSSLPLLLLMSGCESTSARAPESPRQSVRPPNADTLTLSVDQLLALDWSGRNIGGPQIVDRRAVDGVVEFEIHFPNSPGEARTIDYTSSGSGGRGLLVGIDAAPYQAFALKFTLASVAGPTEPNAPQEVTVGALIGPSGTGGLQTWEPLTLAAAPGLRSGVATTPMNTDIVRRIGFHVETPSPAVWHNEPTAVTLRVEPAPDAEAAAQPAGPEQPKKRPPAHHRPAFDPGGMKAW